MEAKELFDICLQLATEEPSPRASLRLHELLSLTAARGCSGVRGAFGNLFAQIDFLCKRLGIDAAEKREIQTARRNSGGKRRAEEDASSTGSTEWPFDVRAVALFISAVFRTDVPASLRRLLPPTPRPHEKGLRINKLYVRCIVRTFDDTTIWADTGEGEVTIDYGTTSQGRDFAYLNKILREGMMLNLLDCNLSVLPSSPTTPHLTPTIIIVEPDFLIDISSLAACFTAYGHHPLLYTLNRLRPRPNSQSTLLGNFAGVALDLSVHQPGSTVATALRRAFREDALRYCACPDLDPAKFKQEAARQMANIAQAVEILQAEAGGHGGFLLEPSFVCEQLGLQGRVDLMTADMSLLVEQKSGKNMKIEHNSHDSHGLQLEAHYVQLLLYYATLRYNFQRGDREVDTRLLYSRYAPSQGLLAVNYYRTLLREALKLRNQVVATELLIARDGFQRILPLLNADIIYKDVVRDGYFHRYVQPPLTALNASLRALTPLERAYLERMMTFVYREQAASRMGSSEQRLHHSGGAASDLWLMPLEEKQETGNIFLGLTIDAISRSDSDGGYDLIRIVKPQPADTPTRSPSNFRRGDMVYLYQYDGEPDVRRAILYKGTISDIADDHLTVSLTDGQQNGAVFNNDRPWAVEHGGSDITTSGSIRSLFQLVTAHPQRRALLLGQREPQADTSLRLSHPYNPHYDDILTRIRQATDYFLLVGPPGTGKTSMALRFIVQEELATHTAQPTASILLCAYTNRAVDEICAMLDDAGQDYLRLGSTAACDPRFKSHLVSEMVGDAPQLSAISTRLSAASIIVSTTTMLLSRPYIFDLKHFSLAVVDEASQILEPGLIGLLSSDRIDRFVLIGDHKQLPAVVQQGEEDAAVAEPTLRAIGITDCRQSLFQRLYQWELAQGRRQFVGTLTHQGRMHPDVSAFASHHFYAGHLLPVPIAHQKETAIGYDAAAEDHLDELLKTRRVMFLSVRSEEKSLCNLAEARLVADLLRRIHRFYGKDFDAAKTVGVIVPYRSQIAAIMDATAGLGIDGLSNIAIDTVERYQGSQRDVIIYSFTVSHRYQLDFLAASTYTDEDGQLIDRKLNVALTRARKQTIMVGNPDVLCTNPLFRRLVQDYSVMV